MTCCARMENSCPPGCPDEAGACLSPNFCGTWPSTPGGLVNARGSCQTSHQERKTLNDSTKRNSKKRSSQLLPIQRSRGEDREFAVVELDGRILFVRFTELRHREDRLSHDRRCALSRTNLPNDGEREVAHQISDKLPDTCVQRSKTSPVPMHAFRTFLAKSSCRFTSSPHFFDCRPWYHRQRPYCELGTNVAGKRR